MLPYETNFQKNKAFIFTEKYRCMASQKNNSNVLFMQEISIICGTLHVFREILFIVPKKKFNFIDILII